MATNGISTLGNRTFLYGGASGIDTSALITVAYNQRKAEADKIDVQVKSNTARFDAYTKLQSLGQAVQTSLANIKKNYSVLAQNNGLFSSRTGTLSSTGSTTSPASLANISIDPGTALGSYEVEVVSKAKAHRVASTASFTDTAADLGYTGSFDIAVAGKAASTINVTSDMSLSELATAINTQSTTTGVSASVVQATPTTYQLILTGTETAKSISISNIAGTDVMQSIGVTSGATFPNEIQAAQQAQVDIDGVSYFRDTNNFDDVISGVNLTVRNAEPGTVITLDVENDNSGIKDGIIKFIDAYNSLRDYIKEQQVVSDDGEVGEDAVLFGDTLLKTMTSSVQSVLAGSYGSGGTNMATLLELGITLDSNSKLVMDETKFDTALTDNFEQVEAIFTTSVTSDNSSLRMMVNTSTQGSRNFNLDITYSGGAITGASVGGDSSLFTISGQSIKGNAGTVYEGMTFAYVGTTSATVNINVQQGFADMMDATMDLFADSLTGTLQTEMLNIGQQNTELEARSSRILERAGDYRDRLIEKYALLESKMAAAQSVLTQLRAILGTNNNE